MKRVLFVDGDRQVLEGLRLSLRRWRRTWEMSFAESAREAAVKLGERTFDVVVAELALPDGPGLRVLEHARQTQPGTARIVLSGETRPQQVAAATPVVHQFVSKPCEPRELARVIERASCLHALSTNEAVRAAIGNVSQLPTAPKLYQELTRAVSGHNATVRSVASVIKRDPGVSAKVLQLGNSAFFRASRTFRKIEDAVGYLGLVRIRDLVLALEVFDDGSEQSSMSELQAHALASAELAAKIAGQQNGQAAFTAGLLHDVGFLVLAQQLPEELEAIRRDAAQRGVPLDQVEKARLGATHAEIGAYLLDLWGLPPDIVEAVATHHHPAAESSQLDVAGATFVADQLLDEISGLPCSVDCGVDDFVGRLHGSRDIDHWRGWVKEAVGSR